MARSVGAGWQPARDGLRNGSGLRLAAILAAGVLAAGVLLVTSAVSAQEIPPHGASRQPAPLHVVIDDTYPPYVFRDEHGGLQGIRKDMWDLWSRKTGIPVILRGMAWGEALAAFQSGRAEVIDTIFQTASRRKVMLFSSPYAAIDVPIYFHRDIGGISGVSTLAGFTVGVKRGDACVEFLAGHGITTLQAYASYATLVAAAAAGEIKVYCIDQPPARYLLIKAGLEDLFRHTEPLYRGEFHWAVPRDRPDLYSVVADGFARIAPEEAAEIQRRWLGSPVLPAVGSDLRRWLLQAAAAALVLVAALVLWNQALRRRVATRTRALSAALERLEAGERRFRSVVDNINDAVFIQRLDDGSIEFANQRMSDMYGHAADQVPALRFEDLSEGVPPYTQAEAMAALHRAADGVPQVFEWRARHRDGTLFWVEVAMRRAAIAETGDRLLVVVRDISERKAFEQELQRTIDALTRSNADLERFAYLASHDLREPLRSVVLFAQLLERRCGPALDADGREYLGFLIAGARRMTALVDGLLEFSRIDSADRTHAPVDLAAVVAVVRQHLDEPLRESGARFDCGPLPVVVADELHLVHLIQNLVANAIKFRHPDRPPRIAFSALRSGAYWAFAVADNGIGIEAPYLDQIFVIFKRLHTQQAVPGSGIGLALCKRIVEAHGGRIWAESEIGVGTTICFLLPADDGPGK